MGIHLFVLFVTTLLWGDMFPQANGLLTITVKDQNDNLIPNVKVVVTGEDLGITDSQGQARIQLKSDSKPGKRIIISINNKAYENYFIEHPVPDNWQITITVKRKKQTPLTRPRKIVRPKPVSKPRTVPRPVAIDDTYNNVKLGKVITMSLLNNDEFYRTKTRIKSITTKYTIGIVMLNGKTVTYTAPSQIGKQLRDSFAYTIIDDLGRFSSATVHIYFEIPPITSALTPQIEVKPPPPTPTPVVKINNLQITIKTIENKDRGEKVEIQIQGKTVYLSGDEEWKAQGEKSLPQIISLALQPPILSTDKDLSINVIKHSEPGKKAKGWEMTMRIEGIPSNSVTPVVLLDYIKIGKKIKLGDGDATIINEVVKNPIAN